LCLSAASVFEKFLRSYLSTCRRHSGPRSVLHSMLDVECWTFIGYFLNSYVSCEAFRRSMDLLFLHHLPFTFYHLHFLPLPARSIATLIQSTNSHWQTIAKICNGSHLKLICQSKNKHRTSFSIFLCIMMIKFKSY